MLNGKNIRAKHHCNKLKDKMYGPFEVIAVGKNGWYCTVKLPETWKIHPTFNIVLLERYRGIDSKTEVVEIEADDGCRKMESIIASRSSDDDARRHVYLVKWDGYSQDENTWETYKNVLECLLDLLKDYYSKNPLIERDGRFGKRQQ
jgi:hypothetical protein